MKSDPNKYHRKSIRLKGYDYTQPGAYFVTMVTRHREGLFGEILNGKVHLNQTGKIIKRIWLSIPANFPNFALDEFIFMPNHLHGIIWIMDSRTGEASARAGKTIFHTKSPSNYIDHLHHADASPQHPKGTQPGSLNAIIQNFKSISTRKINQTLNTPGNKIWQRDYFERVIRNEGELDAPHQYIQNNLLKWELDQDNPGNSKR